jgi:hypothetical protein
MITVSLPTMLSMTSVRDIEKASMLKIGMGMPRNAELQRAVHCIK